MKPCAILVNIGRGAVVKIDDLAEALEQGVIGGAGLDVFEVEPLPEDHPLWDVRYLIYNPPLAAARCASVWLGDLIAGMWILCTGYRRQTRS